MYTDLEREAVQIDEQYARDVAALRKREDLSPIGQAEQRATLDTRRRQQVNQLQDNARTRLEADARKNAKAPTQARADHVEALRKTVGDGILANVYARRLTLLTGAQILRAYGEAAPGFEQTLVGLLGVAELSERQTKRTDYTEPEAMEEAVSLAELEQLTTPEALRKLEDAARTQRDGERWLETLDLQTYRGSVADRLGLRPEYVPAPFAS